VLSTKQRIPLVLRYKMQCASAYVAVMLCLTVMACLTASFAGLTTYQSSAALTRRQSTRAYHIAEAGVNMAIAELTVGQDYNGDGIGTLPSTDFGGGSFQVAAVLNAADDYTLTAVGTCADMARSIQVVVQKPQANLSYDGLAAVTANGPVWTVGTITIDGRDYSMDGVLTGDPGVWGITTTDTVTRQGASKVGGQGEAPTTESNIFAELFAWNDGIDNDGDGAVDEEDNDGIDNDGDGDVDEDVNGYPQGPDAALSIPPGSLKSIAQMCGTYFATAAELDAYVAANGGNMPGGKIVYCEDEEWLPADFGSDMNAEPSIFILHNDAGTATLKNLHGQFKGLLLVDHVVHVNSNAVVLGAIMSFDSENYGSSYGNGNADILYSSEVLANLPSNPAGNRFFVRSWREVAAQ